MKTYSFLAIILVAITFTVSVFASPSDGKSSPQSQTKIVPQDEIKRGNFTINVYNEGDRPPTLPFISILFFAVPDTSVKQIADWREEIDQKIKKLGGISSKEDYEKKVTPILLEYIRRFVQTGAKAVRIDFPRIKQGVVLYEVK